jgi:hypothetical protein
LSALFGAYLDSFGMRRPLRNIEIFSMSVLDMFASALGAFIIITVILFPYFNNYKRLDQTAKTIQDTISEIETVSTEIHRYEDLSAQQQQQLRDARQAQTLLGSCQRRTAACRAALSKAFLIVGIEWRTPCDVDLHVTDPDLNEFDWQHVHFSNSSGELSLDMKKGPGIEIWTNSDARPGDYRIGYRLYCPVAVPVRGWIIDRSAGIQPLPTTTLEPAVARAVLVATIGIHSDGSTTITAASH